MNFLTAIACHFIDDFALQPDWMATWKGKSWEINFYHAMIYISGFVLMNASLFQIMVLGISHFCIDPLKARYKIIKYIWLDQLLHITILCILFL